MSSLGFSQVMGIVSDRDLKAACGVPGVEPVKVTVDSVRHRNLYLVKADTPLREVAVNDGGSA